MDNVATASYNAINTFEHSLMEETLYLTKQYVIEIIGSNLTRKKQRNLRHCLPVLNKTSIKGYCNTDSYFQCFARKPRTQLILILCTTL